PFRFHGLRSHHQGKVVYITERIFISSGVRPSPFRIVPLVLTKRVVRETRFRALRIGIADGNTIIILVAQPKGAPEIKSLYQLYIGKSAAEKLAAFTYVVFGTVQYGQR